jgi:lipoprotein-releasing system permease protein
MFYESRIGWRYLHQKPGDRRHLIGATIFACMAVTGFVLALAMGSGWGIALTGVGMMGGVLCCLLYLFSIVATVSVLGVVLGVAAMTLVLAGTSGFQQEFQDKVLGVNAHVIITNAEIGFTEYRDIEMMAWESSSHVIAVQPFIFGEMQATRGMGYLSGVAIKGVDPTRMNKVLDVHKHMVEGSVETLDRVPEPCSENIECSQPPSIVIGQSLAKKLKARMGDLITVVVPPTESVKDKSWKSLAEATHSVDFQVTGIFYSGFAEYDQRLMYINLKDFQEMLAWGDKVMGVELKLGDPSQAHEVAQRIEKELGSAAWRVQDWHSLNKGLFTMLTLQKIALIIVLTLIIAVAAFNMVGAMTMMVVDKTAQIAIMRSMGSTSLGVARVFQTVGMCIGGVGTGCGLIVGLTLCILLQRYNLPLDPSVYLIDKLPLLINPAEVVLVASITMVISGIATWFPAVKASLLSPVEGLRYD